MKMRAVSLGFVVSMAAVAIGCGSADSTASSGSEAISGTPSDEIFSAYASAEPTTFIPISSSISKAKGDDGVETGDLVIERRFYWRRYVSPSSQAIDVRYVTERSTVVSNQASTTIENAGTRKTDGTEDGFKTWAAASFYTRWRDKVLADYKKVTMDAFQLDETPDTEKACAGDVFGRKIDGRYIWEDHDMILCDAGSDADHPGIALIHRKSKTVITLVKRDGALVEELP